MDNNMVLFKDMIKYMNEKTKSIVTIKSCGQDIDVTPVISLFTFDNCVAKVISMLYDNEGNYIPNLKDFVIRIVLLFAYTNVEMPNDITDMVGELYDLVYRTSFYNDVMKVANSDQVAAFLCAVDDAVKYQNENDVSRINRQITTLANNISSLGEQFADMLGDISNDDIKKILSAIDGNAIDEAKLIEAYTKAVANNG